MVILDSDHISLLQRGGAESQRIATRLVAVPSGDIATTIITFEEQMRGWLARIANGRTLDRQISDYAELKKSLHNFCNLWVLEFDSHASAELARLKQARIRIGTMDLKIAAITLANGAILLTRNTTDFQKVPDLRFE